MLSLMEAGGVGFLVALFATPVWIRYLQHRSYGQQIREDGPPHQHKAGTPTMGGVVIVLAALIGYLMTSTPARVIVIDVPRCPMR